jgi:ABC-2 type transport system permease protein
MTMTTPRANAMQQLVRETRADLLKLFRTPSFIIPTVMMPVAFYTLFGLGMKSMAGGHGAIYLLATYVIFGSMAPGLFGIGTALAMERASGWFDMQRASPQPIGIFLVAKVLVAVALALLSMTLVMATARLAGGVHLPLASWGLLVLVTVLSAIPFALLGLAIGLWARQGGAAALANLLFLPVAFFSGLWFPLEALLPGLQNFGWVLPAYHLAQLSLMVTGLVVTDLLWVHLAVVLAWILGFAWLARTAYQKCVR